MADLLERILAADSEMPEQQVLVAKTSRASRPDACHFGTFLAQRPSKSDDPSRTPFTRDYVVRGTTASGKTERQTKPASVRPALVPSDHVHLFLGHDRCHF